MLTKKPIQRSKMNSNHSYDFIIVHVLVCKEKTLILFPYPRFGRRKTNTFGCVQMVFGFNFFFLSRYYCYEYSIIFFDWIIVINAINMTFKISHWNECKRFRRRKKNCLMMSKPQELKMLHTQNKDLLNSITFLENTYYFNW